MTDLRPTKIVCVGKNYAKHAAEMGSEVPSEPLIFMKPPSALIGAGDPIVMPAISERVDYEGEIGLIIGKRASNISKEDAWSCIEAIVPVNDVTARDLQKRDNQWTRAKGLDGFGPVSAFVRVVEPGWALPVERLELRGLLDDVEVQRSSLAAMVFSIPALIEHLSEHMTLEPGDLIFTGTPAGVSPLSPKQVVRVELEGFVLAPLVTPIT